MPAGRDTLNYVFVFGSDVSPAPEANKAEWIRGRLGSFGTVGGLVPNMYDRCSRVAPAPFTEGDWWEEQRAVVAAIARTAARHTSTPEQAWFAIWTGHSSAYDDPAIHPQLAQVGTFDLPHRSYYLLSGPVTSASSIDEPGGRGMSSSFRPPDLWWPEDRAWFVATDVDFWSNFVGGSVELAEALAEAVPTSAHEVTLDDRLPDDED